MSVMDLFLNRFGSHKPILRNVLRLSSGTEIIINKRVIGNYFLGIKKHYGMNSPREIQLYTKDVLANL